jgi:coenzyme Q-binding protein COQ10
VARKQIKEVAVFAVPREIVYQVVADVARYPEFLPGMYSVKVRNGLVKMTVKKGPLQISWTNKGLYYPPERVVFELADGPFSVMDGSWTFEEVPEGTKVTYELEYELLWPIPGAYMLVKANAVSAMEAFKKRVHQLAAEKKQIDAPAT